MAWTVSAHTRGDFADAHAEGQTEAQATAFITALGSGELHRGLCILFAAFLTIAGTAAAHLQPVTMAAFLFLTGAALALAAFPIRHQSGQKQDAGTWKPQTTPHFQELTEAINHGAAVDRDRWATLTAHMSHELRTPLNAVIGFSELMAQEAFGPLGCSKYGSYAKDIHTSGKSLLKAAEDALAITAILTAQGASTQTSTVKLASVVHEAYEFWSSDLNKSAMAIHIDIDDRYDVAANPQWVRQMLINLLYDAQKRALSFSTLTITATSENDAVILKLVLAPSTDHVEPTASSFGLKMATTLAELIGAKLDCSVSPSGAWQARVGFAQTSQSDLFA